MLARIPVILIGIPAVFGLLVAAGDEVRFVFLTLIALLGQFELNKMLNRDDQGRPFPEWLGGVVIMSSAHLYAERGLLFGFALAAMLLMFSTVLRGLKGNGTQRFCNGLFSLFYLPMCLSFFLMLARNNNGLTLFIILGSIWALDIGAYCFGMKLRGPKLAPQISPNKTVSGAIGGAATCILYFLAIGHFRPTAFPDTRIWALALAVAITGQIADLFESVMKRESEVKDSGNILGAHGGILDRIDSILFLGPVCYALLTL